MIYAIETVGLPFIKFGKAVNVQRRLAAHQISCPLELRLVAEAQWPDSAEVQIHDYLAHCCERGEWFKPSPAVNRVIKLMRNGEDGWRAWLAIVHRDMTSRPEFLLRRLGSALVSDSNKQKVADAAFPYAHARESRGWALTPAAQRRKQERVEYWKSVADAQQRSAPSAK